MTDKDWIGVYQEEINLKYQLSVTVPTNVRWINTKTWECVDRTRNLGTVFRKEKRGEPWTNDTLFR